MSKTVADIRNEREVEYYPNGLPTFDDFEVGDRVKVITPCQDFHFFDGETGVIVNKKENYLGIHVKFDKPRKFTDGAVQESFSFNPRDLVKIGRNVIGLCYKCGKNNTLPMRLEKSYLWSGEESKVDMTEEPNYFTAFMCSDCYKNYSSWLSSYLKKAEKPIIVEELKRYIDSLPDNVRDDIHSYHLLTNPQIKQIVDYIRSLE